MPLVVPSEYKRTSSNVDLQVPLDEYIHPTSNNSRRFVVGDRFHTRVNPHKSALCKYHDINLCQQAATIKTSYQESRNKSKKDRRIQSASMQNFHIHFLYCYLMDFYQNEQIVEKQRKNIQALMGKQPSRDKYMRFVV